MVISQAMMDGTLSPINGRNVPQNVGNGPLYGHSALGEDIIWPGMAEKGAEIGTKAMLDAIADITVACVLLKELNPEKVVATPVHVGSGTVTCAHGVLPVPAPATAHILQGILFILVTCWVKCVRLPVPPC